ncbi:hypothetical protein Tco_0020606 [Tanacetum coccineum]
MNPNIGFNVYLSGPPKTKKSKKSKESNKEVFTIYLHYDGLFITSPLTYAEGSRREINDINFDGMSLDILCEIVKKLVPATTTLKRLYYCKTGTPLPLGIKECNSDNDVQAMLKAGYENGNMVDLYAEQFDYDVMSFINSEANVENIENDSDYYDSDDYEDIENVDFQTEADDNVVVKDFSTHDGFLNKLCTTRAVFRGSTSRQQVDDIPEEDPQNEEIDAVFKIKKGVNYPTFDPTIPWDKMEPVLGMKYESPHQLKLALTNYGVAHGYQMWYMKNDWRSVLVFCGKNPDEGRCAGMKGNKNRKMTVIDSGEGSSNQVNRSKVKKVKKVKKSNKGVQVKNMILRSSVNAQNPSGEGTSQQASGCQSPKWTKKKISETKNTSCPFRLYASWMSSEHSFQIKSLISDHRCCRNYNLGSLVTYKWIALQYADAIIADLFISYNKMKADIRQKFMIDVSLGQCRRAKQRALFDHEGGLFEHYSRL